MRLWSSGLLLAGAFLASSASSQAQVEEAAPELTSYFLDNGLQVVLVPDHRVPKVAVTVNYRVGGVNEPEGRSGFAHLFEHLMFSGTDAWPEFDATFAALGISNNAFTHFYVSNEAVLVVVGDSSRGRSA